MAIHWQVQFRSLRSNTLYSVNIYDADYNGATPVQLTGADQPFSTEELSDDDWFCPVRTQSGYLRIYDTGKDNAGNTFDWQDMMPATAHSRPVTLTHVENGTTIIDWQGYMQPQTFTGDLFVEDQVREFPVMCPISTVEGINVDTTERGVVNFASLLQYIIAQTGISFNHYYFQGSDAIEWLQLKVDWENFVDIEDGIRTAKYDLLKLLEEFCKYFGLTCRTWRNNIYFVCPDDKLDSDFIYLDDSDLDDIANESAQIHYETVQWVGLDSDDDIYESDENIIDIIRGYKKIKITAEINKKNSILEFPYKDLNEILRNVPVVSSELYNPPGFLFTKDNHHGGWNHLSFSEITVDWLPSSSTEIGASLYLSEYYQGVLTYKHNYDFSERLFLKGFFAPGYNPSADDYFFRLVTKSPHYYDHGMFVISGNVSQYIYPNSYNGDGNLVCSLRIGDKWWNGNAWLSSKSVFNIRIGDEENGPAQGQGKIVCNRVLDGPYQSYDGHGIPIDDKIGGVIEFRVVNIELTDEHSSGSFIYLSDLKFSFARLTSYSNYNDRSANKYEVDTGSVFTGTYKRDTNFASDNGNTMGIGIVMNPDGSYCERISYTYDDEVIPERPEEHLLNRMKERFKTTKIRQRLEVNSAEFSVNPTTYVETGQIVAYPMEINREWRDDVSVITLIEE